MIKIFLKNNFKCISKFFTDLIIELLFLIGKMIFAFLIMLPVILGYNIYKDYKTNNEKNYRECRLYEPEYSCNYKFKK